MSTIRLALFGNPVSQSPSPGVHRAFGAQFGLDVDYRLIEASEEVFPARLESFRKAGGSGCNTTLPLKHLACEIADERSSRAELAGAANTLWWDPDECCHADNTDGEGLVRDLQDNLAVRIAGAKVLLLGAGGAAAGVLGALLERRPSRLTIANRTLERARELAGRHSESGEVRCLGLDEIERCGAVDLLIEATSMGHAGESPDIPAPVFDGGPVVYSLNYGPAARPLQGLCEQVGAPFHDGLGMLVEQAACSFEIWTGNRPETAPLLADLRGAKSP